MKSIPRTKVSKRTETSETLTVLRLLGDGFTQKQVSSTLKFSKAKTSKLVKKLVKDGFLDKICRTNINIYALTEDGKTAIKNKKFPKLSYTTRATKMTVHGLQLTIPVSVRKELNIWGKWIQLKNQVQRTAVIKELDLTVREMVSNNGTCSIGIQTNKNIRYVPDLRSAIKDIVYDVFEYFLKLGYILDRRHYKVGNIHIWNGEKANEKVAKDYPDNLLLLGRRRAKFTPKDTDQEAWAKTDGTPEEGVESNDNTYISRYLRMPDSIQEILCYVKDIKNHTFDATANQTQETILPADKWNPAQTTEEMIQSLIDFGEAFR